MLLYCYWPSAFSFITSLGYCSVHARCKGTFQNSSINFQNLSNIGELLQCSGIKPQHIQTHTNEINPPFTYPKKKHPHQKKEKATRGGRRRHQQENKVHWLHHLPLDMQMPLTPNNYHHLRERERERV